MQNIILILAIIAGIILFIVGKKKQEHKYMKILGLITILLCLIIIAPSFIRGFADGFTHGPRP